MPCDFLAYYKLRAYTFAIVQVGMQRFEQLRMCVCRQRHVTAAAYQSTASTDELQRIWTRISDAAQTHNS